jgi:hypothetical protein
MLKIKLKAAVALIAIFTLVLIHWIEVAIAISLSCASPLKRIWSRLKTVSVKELQRGLQA